jgi:hypothetical protein
MVKMIVDRLSIEQLKARLIRRGFSHTYGLDYDETYILTIRMHTLQLFLSIVAFKNLECWHFNIKNAFTESKLKEMIFFQLSPSIKVWPGYILQALYSLYSLKQSARDWYELIKVELIKWGFEYSSAEPCLFINYTTRVILLVYVDHIVATTKSKIQLQCFFKTLVIRFNGKNLREIKKILRARVTCNRKNQILYIDQEQYLIIVLDRFGITAEKHKAKTIPTTDYESLRCANKNDERINISKHYQAIGSLLYAMVFTRPNIIFVLGKLSQFMSDLGKYHGYALKNLLRYVKSTI